MSRSKPTVSRRSPVTKYLEWDSQEGQLKFWDKEKGENVLFPKMKFVVLDMLNTVRGFQASEKKSEKGKPIRGTEVRSAKDKMTVYIGGKKYTTDTWDKLKYNIPGIKFAVSVYAGIVKKNAPLETVNIIFSGASVGSWISFLQGKEDYKGKGEVDPLKGGISIVGKTKIKAQGVAKWVEPIFEIFETTEQEDAQAQALDEILQTYFEGMSEGPTDADEVDEDDEGTVEEVEAPTKVAKKAKTIVIEEEDEDVGDDLPF